MACDASLAQSGGAGEGQPGSTPAGPWGPGGAPGDVDIGRVPSRGAPARRHHASLLSEEPGQHYCRGPGEWVGMGTGMGTGMDTGMGTGMDNVESGEITMLIQHA